MAVIERYTPVIELFGKRQAPSHIPFGYNLLGQKAYDATGAWPGKRSSIRLMELDKDAFFYEDALPGQDIFKPRALLLDYDIQFRDCGAEHWVVIHTDAENTARENAQGEYADQLATLQAVPADKRTDEQKRQLAGAQDMIDQLSADGDSFLTTFSNLFNSNYDGIMWGLSVPNVPIDLLCKDVVGQDQAQSFRVLRAAPEDDQASHRLLLKIGNGNTQYALEFGHADSVTFYHYRNMTSTQRRNLETQWEAILDTGRMTAADEEAVRGWKESADAIVERNKLAGVSKKQMSDADKTAVENYKRLIKERKASKKGLDPENEKKEAELKQKLFYADLPVNLQEDTRSLLNRVFDVTIMFHRRGYVSVRLDKNPAWIYQNKGIAKLRGYSTMLPANSHVLIHSDGGAWGIALGRPRHRSHGSLWTTDIVMGFDVETQVDGFNLVGDDFLWEFDADFISTEINDAGVFVGTGPYGTRVEAKVVMIKNGADPTGAKGHIKVPNKYQLQVELFADAGGVYTPEIHYVNFQVLAGAVPDIDAVPTWQSLPSGDPKAKQPVADLIYQEKDTHAGMIEAVVNDLYGSSGLPTDLLGCECNVKLKRIRDGADFNLILHGMVKRPELQDRNKLLPHTLGQLLYSKPRNTSKVALTLFGIEEVLNREVRWPITGNGKFPNDFMRHLCQNAGLREDEYAGIGAGNIGITKLPRPAAGEKPDIKPTPTARYWEYMQEVLKKHCPGWGLYVIDGVLTLLQEVARDRPDLTYTTDAQAGDILSLKKGYNLYQDLEDFYTEAIFTGGVDAQTGKRFSGNKAIPEATNPAFAGLSLFHVGLPKVYVAPIDDGLTSNEACTLAARSWMLKYGKPPWYLEAPVFYNPTVRINDVARFDGVKAIIQKIQRSHLNADRGDLPKMLMTARIYEDII